MAAPRRPPDTPPPPGVTLTDAGALVCVAAGHATDVRLVLVRDDAGTGGRQHREVPLRRRAHGMWWDHVDGVRPGTRYGFRVDGPWDPRAGHRHNPAKLLLDPYARAVDGAVRWDPVVHGHTVDAAGRGDHTRRDSRDSAGHVPLAVVVDDRFDWGGDVPPAVPWAETVIYEAHVAGLTRRHPDVPEHLRGTYAALGHPAVVEHLRSLGVSTLELLPVHTHTPEPALVRRGLTNYWGYNTLGFFAPHPAYAATGDPEAVGDELRTAVRALHRAGLEVILDVVYNHTCEQSGEEGASLSWRGLDNATSYRLDDWGRDVDVTGCGNTLDLRRPTVCRMVLDSLRHWVLDYHVDGFRFDLAPALARGRDDGYDPDHPFLVALRMDPVLSGVKLIAEPWDLGLHGWRTGQFPPPFGEWNDRFRDTARTFWLTDVASRAGAAGPGADAAAPPVTHGVRELATRLAGSADLFGRFGRGPIASVNYVTAHDGFTLHDLTAYDVKHNEANGENGHDGTTDNRSWNHGVEGPSEDAEVRAARRRSARSLLATLLLSAGVPMLTAGDESGRTQGGNNNAYCLDGPVSWLDWAWVRGGDEDHAAARDLLATTRHLLRLRAVHPALGPREFPSPDGASGTPRWRWFDERGARLTERAWHDTSRGVLVLVIDRVPGAGKSHAALVLVLNGTREPVEVRLPEDGVATRPVRLLWCSAQERPEPPLEVRDGAWIAPATSVGVLEPVSSATDDTTFREPQVKGGR